ncbi:MAG: DUF2878 family protein, partial [Pontibacterium sp.]
DMVLSLAGLFKFEQHILGAAVAPLWLFTLWIGFAASLRTSFGFLKGRLVLASVLAVLSGPSSYWAAESLDAVVFPYGQWLTLVVLAVLWAILFPALLFLCQRLELSCEKIG